MSIKSHLTAVLSATVVKQFKECIKFRIHDEIMMIIINGDPLQLYYCIIQKERYICMYVCIHTTLFIYIYIYIYIY